MVTGLKNKMPNDIKYPEEVWEENEAGNWEYCGGIYRFDTGDPLQNRFNFCPECGAALKVQK